MGLSISPDIFQGKMSELLADLPHVKVYMDGILIFSHGSFVQHLQEVERCLQRLSSKNMAVSPRKTFWAVSEVDYLGFGLTKQGISPQARKVKAILGMDTPKIKQQLRQFIGLGNWYQYM
jgi:hypothetical protein